MHAVDLADALFLVLRGVDDLLARLQHTGVHADIGELAEVRIAGDLECQCRERFVVRHLTLDLAGLVFRVETDDALDVERRREVVNDGVEHRLNALVLESRTGEDRGDLEREGGATHCSLDVVLGELLVQELLGEFVVGICDDFEHLLMPFVGVGLHVGGDVLDRVVLALLRVFRPDKRLHTNEVDDAAEAAFGADRQLHDCRDRIEAIDDHLHAAVEVRTRAVELVDEADTRNGGDRGA